jgi:GBP family porin
LTAERSKLSHVGPDTDLILEIIDMKKTLLAAAALVAVSGSALAQSSLTIYGVVDASLESVKAADKSVTRVSSDNYATSRLGFKGTEDLGGGLKAIFALETAVKADTGENGGKLRFWDRAAWVGLAGGFGDLRLGRIDSSIGALAGNTAILGAQGYDDFKIAKTVAGDKYRRLDNAITYTLPTLVAGLTAQFQYSLAGAGETTGKYDNAVLGAETAGVDTGKVFGVSAQYVAGPYAAGAGYLEAKANTNGSVKDSAALAFASYDFGPAKLTGYYDVDSASSTKNQQRKKEILGVKVGVPFSASFSLTAGLSKVRNATGSSAKDDATIVAVKGVYTLSKRTAVYGLLTNVDNEALSNLAVAGATGANDKASYGIAVGVRHAF